MPDAEIFPQQFYRPELRCGLRHPDYNQIQKQDVFDFIKPYGNDDFRNQFIKEIIMNADKPSLVEVQNGI